jgi:hypothetical protein
MRALFVRGGLDPTDNALEALNTPFPDVVTREFRTPAEPDQPQTGMVVGISAGKLTSWEDGGGGWI